jgi:hypothetical protein
VTEGRVLNDVPEAVLQDQSMMFYICNKSGEPLNISWGRDPRDLNMHHGLIEPFDQDVAHDAVSMASAVQPGERIWVVGQTADGNTLQADIVILEGIDNVVDLVTA